MEDGPPNEDHVELGVADLDAACDDLRTRGVEFLVELCDFPYLRDPDGRLVELAQA